MSKAGDVIVKLLLKSDNYEKGLKKADKSTKSFSKSMAASFTAALGAIGLVISAIAGIAKACKGAFEKVVNSNQALHDQWARTAAAMKGSTDELARSVASLDFTNVVERMRQAADAARDLYNAVDAMGEITTAYNIASAEQQKHLAKLAVDMRNPNLSYDERIKAAKEYLKIFKELESMPLRGLGNVSNATLKNTLVKMGYDMTKLSSSQIEALKKELINFFKWLGTAEGEAVNSAAQRAAGGGRFRDVDETYYFQQQKKRGSPQLYTQMALMYNKRMNDEDREELEKAVTDFMRADASYDESTRRVQTLLYSLEYQKTHQGSGGKGKRSDDVTAKAKAMQEAVRKSEKEALELANILPDQIRGIQAEMPDLVSDDWLKRQQQRLDEWLAHIEYVTQRADEVSKAFNSALQSGIVAGIDMMTEAIGSGEDMDAGAMVKALLSPLADACITAGMLIMSTGKGVEALKASLIKLQGFEAIAVGAALIGIGIAAKTGLAAIATKKSGSTSTGSASSGSSGGDWTQNLKTEMTIYVKGRVDGRDIVLSGQRTIDSWSR